MTGKLVQCRRVSKLIRHQQVQNGGGFGVRPGKEASLQQQRPCSKQGLQDRHCAAAGAGAAAPGPGGIALRGPLRQVSLRRAARSCADMHTQHS